MESHNYRFNDGTRELKSLIDSGSLGTVREVEVRVVLSITDPSTRFGDPNLPSSIHSLPAGALHDFTTHMAYLLLYLAGDITVQRVRAAWNNHSGNTLFRYDNLDAVVIGTDEGRAVHGRLRFDAGAGPERFTLKVFGTQGWAETDLFRSGVKLVCPRGGGQHLGPSVNDALNGAAHLRSAITSIGNKVMQRTPYHGLHTMLSETYDALIEGRPLPVSEQDMTATAQLVDSILDENNRF